MQHRVNLIATLSFVGLYLIQKVTCRVGYSSERDKPTEEACNGTDGLVYMCSTGHCCDGDRCCPYYYELWWFWLILGIVFLLGCCCLYHRRQKKLEQRLRRRRARQRHREAYSGVCNYPGPPSDNDVLGYCKLPHYNDVIRIPPTSSPPPPYSTRRRSIHTIACLQPNEQGETMMTILPCNITSSMLSLASLSHYIPELLVRNSIPPLVSQSNRDVERLPVDDNNNIGVNIIQSITSDQFTQSGGYGEKVPITSAVESDFSVKNEVTTVGLRPLESSGEGCSYAPPVKNNSENFEPLDASDDEEDCLLGSDVNNNNNNPPLKLRGDTTDNTEDVYHSSLPEYSSVDERLLNGNPDDNDSGLNGGDGNVVLHLSPT